MKKTIFTLFLVAILSLSAVVPCFAEGNDATLKTIYSYNAEEDKITVDARFFDIKAKEGIIKVLEIQGENAKRMSVQDFLRGNNIEVGAKFE